MWASRMLLFFIFLKKRVNLNCIHLYTIDGTPLLKFVRFILILPVEPLDDAAAAAAALSSFGRFEPEDPAER